MHGLVPAGIDDPLWWTLRRPFTVLGYHAAYRMFSRANAALGANWSLHDLRHTAAYRMARDPDVSLTDVQWVLGHAHLSTTQLHLIPLTEDVIARALAHHARVAADGATATTVPKGGSSAPSYRPEALNDRTEEAGRTFHEAARRYRSRTAEPVTTLGLIIAISLTEKLVETDSERQAAERLTGRVSREQVASIRTLEDPPAELCPVELRPAADNLRAVCAPLYPAAEEVCRAAVRLHLTLMNAAETLINPPPPFSWYEPDEALMKHRALSESITRFTDALSARLESWTGSAPRGWGPSGVRQKHRFLFTGSDFDAGGRTGLGIEADRRGPARPDRAVLVERQPVRHVPPGHGQATRPRVGRRRGPPPHMSGGCGRVTGTAGVSGAWTFSQTASGRATFRSACSTSRRTDSSTHQGPSFCTAGRTGRVGGPARPAACGAAQTARLAMASASRPACSWAAARDVW
ncbi:site-specific tyrosine recombinase XerC [Streptomyces malaysiensis subsp. malaysiensis]|uniref:site-specific integrase n=1 Tax=Streptomyces malaysiensis TaxID=92644 RepID=UPI000CA1CC78|nr:MULTISPECIES: site-specific integrase [unclassified Streptomyces]AUA17273.1 site-specific tyrosine recombinase XerC [Streptomyces sp. M56]